MEVSDAKKLKGLEAENARLKKLLADQMLDNAALKELLSVVKPAVKRRQVFHLVESGMASMRRACGLVGISRSVVDYRSCREDDTALRRRLRKLGEQYPRYGYLMLHALLKQEGLVCNAKRTYRLYTEEGLQVRTKKRRKISNAPRQPMVLPSRQGGRLILFLTSSPVAAGSGF